MLRMLEGPEEEHFWSACRVACVLSVDRADIGTRAKETEEKGRREETPLSTLPSLRLSLSLVPFPRVQTEKNAQNPTEMLATHAT